METSFPNQKANTNGLKAIIGILTILLLGSLSYMYKLSLDNTNSIALLKTEKETVVKDLESTKQALDAAIANNTTLSDELIVERDKIQKLLSDLEKTKSTDASSISKYKMEADKVKSKIAVLLKKIEGLQKENATLATKIDSTSTELKKAITVNDTLVSQNDYLAKTVEKGAKLSIVNLQTTALKQKSGGKQVETDKASRADVLKISFTIAENQIAKSGDKHYFVQIIDSNNTVLGEKREETFNGKTVVYSFVSNVRYENKTVKVEKEIQVADIKEGTFFVNVFDKSELVAKTTFILR